MIDRLAQNAEFRKYDSDSEKLPEYLDKLLNWAEGSFEEIIKRVNYLIAWRYDIEDHTADDTLLENESGSVHTNLGATGAVTLTLPASPTKGTNYKFCVQAAQELRIDPRTATIRDDSGQTADKYKTANAIGECIEIVANSNGDWVTVSKYGTWTEEP